jgi:hypothetical protein
MTTADGESYIEKSDKLSVAEHFYDCFVENGKQGKQDFYVSLLCNEQEKMNFNGWHTA